MQKAIIILGPTSSGKTSFAIKLAKKINGAIISADSRQVYKYMDIGTGKIPVTKDYKIQKKTDKWQIDNVNVYMYDLVFPNQQFSVSDYVIKAKQYVADIIEKNQIPIIVGGTGFYIDILTSEKNVFPVAPNINLRKQLSSLSLPKLQQTLLKIDQNKFNQIDIQNPIRLIRAIEIAQSGKNDESIGLVNFKFYKIGLSSIRENLFLQADNWVKQVLKSGLIAEVKDLVERGYIHTQPMQGIIYKTTVSYLNGDIILKEDLQEKLKFELHNYIRRQQTYFKKSKNINWYDIKDNTFDQNATSNVRLFLNG